MRKVVIASSPTISSLLRTQIKYGITARYSKDRSGIGEWEKAVPKEILDAYHSAIFNHLVEWEISTRTIPGTYSRHAYSRGARGEAAKMSETCWRLVERHTKEKTKEEIQYGQARYLWKNHSSEFSNWEISFMKTVGDWLAKGKPLTGPQQTSFDKLLKKYKIPNDATASSN